MKLATKKDMSPDGQLHIVSRDLTHSVAAIGIAPSLRVAIENWEQVFPALQILYHALNEGSLSSATALDVRTLAAPLPRAWQWLDASAFHAHSNLMEKVFGIEPPPDKLSIPLMYQGASDEMLGAYDDVPLPLEADGMDFEAELAAIVDRVPMGTTAQQAMQHVKLLTIANDVSLRALAGRELKTGFGFVQAKPTTSFGPVAVTPDELGDAWRDGRVHLPLCVDWNGVEFGHPNCGAMGFSFGDLIQHAARTRNLSAATLIGTGTISNENYRAVGSACIAERRAIELHDDGRPKTGYMKFGDRVRIEMFDSQNRTIFGAIDQLYVQAKI